MLKRFCILLAIIVAAGLAYTFLPEPALPQGVTADRVRIIKHSRRLLLLHQGRLLKQYTVALGRYPKSPKRCQGDKRTPEGQYKISGRNPHSSYYKSLRISYPSIRDRAIAAKLKCDPGGDIMIHGLPNRLGWLGRWQRRLDWTAGCVALTNREMDELWRAVPDGTPVEILH